jgi:hypothetical protein
MAIGWDDVQRMKRVEARAEKLGFRFGSANTSWVDIGGGFAMIYLKPKDDCLPHYNRDAQIFAGSLESIDNWLDGIEWARSYEELLKLSNDKKRSEKEQSERNRQLLRTIKTGRKVEGVIGATDVNEWRAQLEDEFDDEIPF